MFYPNPKYFSDNGLYLSIACKKEKTFFLPCEEHLVIEIFVEKLFVLL